MDVRKLLGVLVAVAVLAGCSSSAHPKSTPTPSPPPTPTATSETPIANEKLNERCPNQTDGISAVPFTFAAGDGTRLTGLEMGQGARGVVMVHELGGAGLCGWLPYGKYLAAAGLHVLLYDTRCSGASTCPDGAAAGDIVSDVAGAKAELTRRGAREVAVLGASYGGAIALTSAVAVKGLRACVVLSGDLYDNDLGPGLTGTKAASRVAVPVLYAVATDDGNRLATARGIVAKIKPSLVKLQVLSGPAHGWDMLQNGEGGPFTPLAAQVRAFLDAHLR
jgi:dienelactone hydrolase